MLVVNIHYRPLLMKWKIKFGEIFDDAWDPLVVSFWNSQLQLVDHPFVAACMESALGIMTNRMGERENDLSQPSRRSAKLLPKVIVWANLMRSAATTAMIPAYNLQRVRIRLKGNGD